MSFSLEKLVVISPEGKWKPVVDVLSRLGASHPECPNEADVLTEGDLHGHHSHGLQQLPVLETRI